MAQINFFDRSYIREETRTDKEFGICDPGNNLPAFTTLNTQLYQAIVHNNKAHTLQFVAIDHNLNIRRPNGDLESTCDGMLFDGLEYLSFIELKDKDSNWAKEAVEQLETTINIFRDIHNCDDFKRRYAFAVNKRHPNFHHSFKETMQRFKSTTNFFLRFGLNITVDY